MQIFLTNNQKISANNFSDGLFGAKNQTFREAKKGAIFQGSVS